MTLNSSLPVPESSDCSYSVVSFDSGFESFSESVVSITTASFTSIGGLFDSADSAPPSEIFSSLSSAGAFSATDRRK